MAETVQSYRTHARTFPPYHYFVFPVLAVNFFAEAVHTARYPSLGALWATVVALALAILALVARVMVLTVQDRVIRLEMRLRLRELLPPDLQGRISAIGPKQLTALRFASDAELPTLVREVVDGKLTDLKAIKQRIQDWQGDFLRA
jgi:Family of unknown function (DUF6526)